MSGKHLKKVSSRISTILKKTNPFFRKHQVSRTSAHQEEPLWSPYFWECNMWLFMLSEGSGFSGSARKCCWEMRFHAFIPSTSLDKHRTVFLSFHIFSFVPPRVCHPVRGDSVQLLMWACLCRGLTARCNMEKLGWKWWHRITLFHPGAPAWPRAVS